MNSLGIFSALVLLIFAPVCIAVPANLIRGPVASPNAITGEEPLLYLPLVSDAPPVLSLDEPIGATYAAGTTWYDYQHNGTAGKMIGGSSGGFVHLVWMKGLDSQQSVRHVYYNVWDPVTQGMTFDPSGVQINTSQRAGYVCQAVASDGFAYPGYHQIITGANAHAAVAIDFLPLSGAFTTFEPDYLFEGGVDLQLVWPKIVINGDSVLHMVSTDNAAAGNPTMYRFYYSRGIPEFEDGFGTAIDWQDVDGDEQFLQLGTAGNVSADIATSRMSQRVAVAWTGFRPTGVLNAYNLDVFYRVSEDGGWNWGDELNLSEFAEEDTHRAYCDVSVIFDREANLHVAFSTHYFEESTLAMSLQTGRIWHWDEAHDSVTAVGDNWVDGPGLPGAWHLNACRPSLAMDTVTGYLYCSYLWFDTDAVSENGYYNGEAWVTVSSDSGLTWSVGRNVTETTPPNSCIAGDCLSERDITLAERVTHSGGIAYLDLEWILDLDPGGIPQNEGVATLNTVFFQRIPVDSIPLTPLMFPYQFHVGPPPPPDTGRCCYGDPWNPQCQYVTQAACGALDGEWRWDLDCSTPCPVFPLGRCCYGNPAQPDCEMRIESDCEALNGDWDEALTCDEPCPIEVDCSCQDEANAHCELASWPLPDDGFTFRTITVPLRYHITDVNVCMDISHEHLADLLIDLTAPSQTIVRLLSNQVFGANFRCTVFDDEAEDWIWDGLPPYNGSYKPHFPLNGFDAEIAEGDWMLYVADTAAGDAGWLNWVCLVFEYDFIDEASDVPVPVEYSLSVYPNPFNASTTLTFGVEKSGSVRIELFNLAGQRVRVLVDQRFETGRHAVAFNASELPSGIYLAQIRTGSFVKTEKLVLMK